MSAHSAGIEAGRSREPARAPRRRPLLRLLARLRPIRWQAAGAYGLTVATTAVALTVPLVIRSVLDGAINPSSRALDWLPGTATAATRTRLLMGAGVLVALGVAGAVLSFWQRYGTAWVGRTVATGFRAEVFDRLMELDTAFHDRSSVGQLMTRVTDDTEKVRRFAATAVADLVNIAALLLGAVVVLTLQDPGLALVALAPMPVVAAMALAGAKRLGPRFLAMQQRAGALTATLQESLAQVRVLQAFSAEARTQDAYGRGNEDLYAKRMAVARIFTTIFPAMSTVLSLGVAAVLLVGGQQVLDGDLTIGTLVAFTAYIGLLGQPVRRLGFLLNISSRASASARRVYELLDLQPALRQAAQPLRLPADGAARGRPEWDHVDFGFHDGAPPILDDLVLQVRPGEHVVVVGRSGSGKTTLAQLLVRLYDPTAGAVRLDGVDLRRLHRDDLREAVGYVEQEAFLFSASVHDNVAFARPEATRAEVVEACRLAGAEGFVAALPDGYDTVVGERGVTLSGGQRQRLALARALIRQPAVLLLDDAVSAVDAATEARIRAGLAATAGEGARTVVSIAQRLSTILAADRIVVLEAGRVVEQGSHAELVAADGSYARIFRTALAVSGQAPARGSAGDGRGGNRA